MSLLLLANVQDIRWETCLVSMIGLAAAALVAVTGRLVITQAGMRGSTPHPDSWKPYQRSEEYDFPEFNPWEGMERRVHPREAVDPMGILFLRPEHQKPGLGTIHDRSLGGLGLELTEEVEVGRHLMLRPVDALPHVPWIEVEVRYCRRRGEVYRVGCQFVDTSSWDVMNFFGPPDPDD